MKRRCSLTEQCVGFNTQAEFKSLILPESSWKTVDGEGAGMYIAGEQLSQAVTPLLH